MSIFPSPSISAATNLCGLMPTEKLTAGANEPAEIEPVVDMFRRTYICELPAAAARSGFPSPSKSASTTSCALAAKEKLTLVAKDDAEMEPVVAILRKTLTEPAELQTTISGFPSPSISATLRFCALDGTVRFTAEANDELVREPALLMFR